MHDLAGKLKPRTVPTIGRMHNSACIRAAQLNDCARQIPSICGTAALIVHHIQRRAGRGQFQDRVGKTFSTRTE
jgi:hypothetical protein